MFAPAAWRSPTPAPRKPRFRVGVGPASGDPPTPGPREPRRSTRANAVLSGAAWPPVLPTSSCPTSSARPLPADSPADLVPDPGRSLGLGIVGPPPVQRARVAPAPDGPSEAALLCCGGRSRTPTPCRTFRPRPRGITGGFREPQGCRGAVCGRVTGAGGCAAAGSLWGCACTSGPVMRPRRLPRGGSVRGDLPDTMSCPARQEQQARADPVAAPPPIWRLRRSERSCLEPRPVRS